MLIAAAIADPIRRDILVLLRRGDLTAGDIASRFDVSRPAVSRHLRVLRDAGVVVAEERGRERIYHLDTTPLAELDGWLEPFRDNWSSDKWSRRLGALDTEVRRTARQRRRGSTTAHQVQEDTA